MATAGFAFRSGAISTVVYPRAMLATPPAEGGLHQRIDASLNEDQCRVRDRNAVWVLGMFRRLAVSLFAEWRSRDAKRKHATMTDLQSHMGAEHAAPAMRFITARYPAFKRRS